ncbi:MAG: UDP-glucose:undecaprenyl-phosphate glucose-phosphate transferase, partial [Lacunisphaera sp.]|nr:UDP-glucose:undecaprenyl-phosphate glucose-phosphate transferase [Lacunisphaera sp.]
YFLCVLAGMVVSGRFMDQFSIRYNRIGWSDALRLSSRQIALVAMVVFTAIVATKDRTVSRLFLASFLLYAWLLLTLLNGWMPRYLTKVSFNRAHLLPTLFVGSSASLEKLGEWVAAMRDLGIQPIGYLTVRDEKVDVANTVAPFLGTLAELPRILDQQHIGQLVLLDLVSGKEMTKFIIESCQTAGCRFLIYSAMENHVPVPVIPLMEGRNVFFTLQEEPLESPMNRAMKRLLDITLALPVVVLVLPPLALVVAIIQRAQAPGPLLFIRPRGGHQRTTFRLMKFRSMYSGGADAKREAVQARSGDDRIFPFGRWMRRTSIDEFPQFINVLKGEMSVVGPRPHLPEHDTEFALIAKSYRTRRLVKPGITGLAQISGFRGEISDPAMLQQRVDYDVEYITTWSLGLDVVIALKTARHVFFPPKSAY